MTDLRTRPVEEQRLDEAATGIRTATRGRIIVLALVIGVLAGWLVFTSAAPSRAELEQTRWQQVVDDHERQYQTMADAQAPKAGWQAAYWQDVVDHYARQYELMAIEQQAGADRQSAYWEAVVAHHEQRWELQEQ
ncbi:MAG TPA: hypothetical protein VMS74_07080 [Acidimicrobiia bacterium]|nr:hypothetical protein [Acidimicrobiia bacterium]